LHHQPAAFTPDHQELLQAICHQVGLALSNAERYQQVQSLVDLLEVEKKRLVNLVGRLPVGVLLLDEDHTLLVANSLGSEILGLLGTGAVGKPLSTLGPYDLKDLIAQHASPLPVNITYDGPPQRVFEAQVRPLGIEQSQWVITVREVTEEREIQVRIQMQNRLATVGQLASGIAHDFNNIMAAIMVYADLLQRDLALSPTGRERLAIIQNQVERATSLIRQILDFSRRSVMEQINMDLLPFTKELDKLLERVLPETIHLELSYENEEFWVKADPTRLQQVFMNLAVNARDAMSEGGSLFFLLDRIQLLSSEHPPFPSMLPGEWVRVRVRDTGEGIPPDVIPHIFEPFFTTKPVGEGTGLGLAQAYGIVKQHDGFIDVQSQVGEGTIFTIYLPALAVVEQEVVLYEQLAGIEGEGETILVVEDDQVTLGALRDLLSSQNYNVLMAENGIKALEIFEQRSDSIDLVVCDVVMPEMGGVELFIALSARYPHVKMLFITGHPLQKENHALLERGSVHWMQKPFSVPDFNQALQELLEEQSSIPTP
jgi:signal transduction histidine kinase/ActR/RegA family two-component response regulator